MAQAKFEISRELYKELSLADAKLKSAIEFFEKKEMSSRKDFFLKFGHPTNSKSAFLIKICVFSKKERCR